MKSVLCQEGFRIHGLSVAGYTEVDVVTNGIFHNSGLAHLADDLTGCDRLAGRHFGFCVKASILRSRAIFFNSL